MELDLYFDTDTPVSLKTPGVRSAANSKKRLKGQFPLLLLEIQQWGTFL
jgi:hypothetical protein